MPERAAQHFAWRDSLLCLGMSAVLSTAVGCKQIAERLGNGEEQVESESEPQQTLDAGASPGAPDTKRRKAKAKRRRAKPPNDLQAPTPELDASLQRGIATPAAGESLYRVDPFVLALAAESLQRAGGAPFSRISNRERNVELQQEYAWAR